MPHAAKILLAEDDGELRLALKEALIHGGYSVVEAENGKVASKLLGVSKFDLVISDFQMPEMNGLELLLWVKKNHSIPVVLITGFSQILETQEAFRLGADDFLSKPFNHTTILESVKKVLGPKSRSMSPKDQDLEFCRIPIDDFVSNHGVKIDIYIRLTSDRYIQVAHQGDRLPPDRLENYRRKGLEYLYCKKQDFGQLVKFNIPLSKKYNFSSNVPLQKKLDFVRYSMEVALEHATVNGIDPHVFSQSKECLETCMSVLTESDRLYLLLESLNKYATWVYAHSVGTAIFSIAIGKKMTWNWPPTLFKLGTAGLFHDIGEKELHPDLTSKNRPLMSMDERRKYETHVQKSQEILLNMEELPSDILQIVSEHHEDCQGSGYPRKVKKAMIHPLAKIVSIADLFCFYALKSPHSAGSDANHAMTQLTTFHEGQLDKEALAALKNLIIT